MNMSARSATGSFEISGASRWLEAAAGDAVIAAAARPVSPRVTTRFSIREVRPFVRRGQRGLVDAGYSAGARNRFGRPSGLLSSPPHERGPSGNVIIASGIALAGVVV